MRFGKAGLPMKPDENTRDVGSLLTGNEFGCMDAVAIMPPDGPGPGVAPDEAVPGSPLAVIE